MATHPNILAWEIPRTEEPDCLPSMGLQSHTRLSGYITTMNSRKDMMFRVIYTYAQMPAPLFFAFVTVGKLLKNL